MRITIDIRLLARGGTTGIPGYTRDLIDALLTTNTQHQYALFYNGLRRQPLPPAWRTHPHTLILERSIPNRLLDISFRLLNKPQIDQLVPTDVLFSPHFNLLPATATPRVITFHDLSFLHYPQFFSREQQLWHRLQHYKAQAHAAAHIIAVSEFTKSDLVRLLGIAPEKVSVVYSGINSSFTPLESRDLRLVHYKEKRGLHRPFILSLSSLEPRKNIPLLIRAFNELKEDRRFSEYQLVLAGRPGYRAAEILRAAAQSPYKHDIIFLGPVTDSERVFLYNAARVFVFPSWFEGFGFPPLEAQACGTSVIAADRTSLPEILDTSATLINPWRSSELVDAIIEIETNAKLRETKRVAGLKNTKRFSWTTAAEQTATIFTSSATLS